MKEITTFVSPLVLLINKLTNYCTTKFKLLNCLLCRFGKDIKIVHFLGAVKPWQHNYDAATKTLQLRTDSYNNIEYVQHWWNICSEDILPHLKPEYVRTT